MKTLVVLVAVLLAGCGPGLSPSAPTPTEGSRVVLVTYQGAPVAGHPVHVEEYSRTRDVLTAADGTFTIAGPCDSGVMLSSQVLRPGWMPRTSVQPCGARFEVALHRLEMTSDPIR
jgi:hypothetical protein